MCDHDNARLFHDVRIEPIVSVVSKSIKERVVDRKKFFWAVVTAACILAGCGESGNSSSTDPAESRARGCEKILQSEEFYLQGTDDTLIVYTLQKTDTLYSCAGGSLVVTPVTAPADTDTTVYRLSSDTLRMGLPVIKELDKLLPGITIFLDHIRQSGSGFQGSWKPVRVSYESDSVLNIFQKALLDSAVSALNSNYEDSIDVIIEIDEAAIRTYETWHVADEFLAELAADSSSYEIVEEKLGECQLRLTGMITGEEVVISGLNDRVLLFESDLEAHPDHYYYTENPRSCPNNSRPAWWDQFLGGNRRITNE